jgi:hypothetical protein
MILSKIYTKDEIQYCVDMYAALNDYSFLPVVKSTAVKNLTSAVRRQKFVRVLKESNKIVAWLYADTGISLHMNERVLQQFYYCSDLTGTKAFKAVRALHEELLEYAKLNGYTIVFSPGSHFDEKYVFTRMLEKLGWERRGYIAYKRPD